MVLNSMRSIKYLTRMSSVARSASPAEREQCRNQNQKDHRRRIYEELPSGIPASIVW